MSTQQQVLFVTPIALFEVVEGRTNEKGNCQCAVVALATSPPRFSLTCYNDRREVFCTAPITSSNDHSLQLQLSSNDYASFRDSRARRWSMMFLRSLQVEKFLAILAACAFGAAGAPLHSSTVFDVAVPKSETKLSLSHRAKVSYTAYGVRQQGETAGVNSPVMPLVEGVIETNGDRLYNFQPASSAMSLLLEAKGFEASVTGMMEDSTRVVIVPQAMERNGRTPYPSYWAVAFVVKCHRIVAEEYPAPEAVPVVLSLAGTAPGDNYGASGALALVASSTSVAMINETSPSLELAVTAAPLEKTTSATTASVGSGIPAEHMAMVQKAAAQINTATTNTRDLHDKIVSFREEWQQVVNRPKPSVLTPQNLEQSIKSLIMEHDRVRDELSRRDELIKSLEDRNRDLQKRVDRAAMIAQQLLDEKQKTVASASDLKLEKDRIIMKLQEEVTRASTERDDVQRHLGTIKKLLEVSDQELRDVKGKAEMHAVQTKGLASRLDVAEDQLAEERARRKALEAKQAAMQEEIRATETEVHLKTALLEETRRRADAERNHQAQIMEDERQRRAFEAQQLRTEIIEELQQRENRWQSERARTIDEFHKRGHAEGKELGRRQARVDVENRLAELQLEAQRAYTTLDAHKTELRTANEEAMAEGRRLEAIVRQLKRQCDEVTRKKASLEFEQQSLEVKAKGAEDSLYLGLTSVAHRLIRPANGQDLIEVLAQIKDGKAPVLKFQQEQEAVAQEESLARLSGWIAEDLCTIYNEKQQQHYEEMAPAFETMRSEVVAAVKALWEERDRSFAGALLLEETQARYAITSEEDSWFSSVVAFIDDLLCAHANCLNSEELTRKQLELEEEAFWAELEELRAKEAKERAELGAEAECEGNDIALREETAWQELMRSIERVLFEKVILEQEEVMDDEKMARREFIIDEEDEFSWLRLLWGHVRACAALEAEEQASRLRELVLQEEEGFAAILAAERAVLEEEERQLREAEEAKRRAEEEEAMALAAAEEERRAAAEAAAAAEKEAREAEERARLKEMLEARAAEEAADAEERARVEAEAARARTEEEIEANEQAEALALSEATKKKARKAKKKTIIADDTEEHDIRKPVHTKKGLDDEDDDGPAPPPPMPKSLPKRTLIDSDDDDIKPPPLPPPSKKANRFGSGSDSDQPREPRTLPRVGTDSDADRASPSAEAKKAASPANLFGESDEDEFDNASPPPPRASKKPPIAPKRSLFTNSDSDADPDREATKKGMKSSVDNDSEGEKSEKGNTKPVPPKKTSGSPPKRAILFGDSDSDEDIAPPPRVAPAKKTAPKRSMARNMFGDSDSD